MAMVMAAAAIRGVSPRHAGNLTGSHGARHVDAQVEALVGLGRRVEGPLKGLVQRVDDLRHWGPGVASPDALATPVC